MQQQQQTIQQLQQCNNNSKQYNNFNNVITTANNIIQSTMYQQKLAAKNFVCVKAYDFIELYPQTIRAVYVDNEQNRIYVARTNYSQIYEMQVDEKGVHVQQIGELQGCQHLVSVEGMLVMFKAFEMKVFRKQGWEHHSFTTQLLTIRVQGSCIFSFHQQQSLQWSFQDSCLRWGYLHTNNTPYHLTPTGQIAGQGKHIPIFNNRHAFTCCEVMEGQYVFVGDSGGALHVYDWQYLAHVTTIKKHQGAVLAIKVDVARRVVYYTGCDSKICIIKQVEGEWHLSNQIRGQSHDILCLQLTSSNHLISGGLTTDLCFYPLHNNGQFQGNTIHKVSYTSERRVDNQGKYLLVNKITSFQIWQIAPIKQAVKLMVEYTMPQPKCILLCKMSRQNIQDHTFLIVIVTEEDTVGWKFNAETGLNKFVTIQNCYRKLEFITGKHIFIALKHNNQVQKIYCKTGKIEQLFNCQISIPTDFKLLSNNRLLIGSRITNCFKIFNYKTKQLLAQHTLDQTYTYIEELDANRLMIKYFNNANLYELVINSSQVRMQEKWILQLPVRSIRFGGWLQHVTKQPQSLLKATANKYWYGASEGKIVIITNLSNPHKRKKIRVKQTQRIAQIIKPTTKHYGCNLAIVPLNFNKMIDQMPIKPLFTKKII